MLHLFLIKYVKNAIFKQQKAYKTLLSEKLDCLHTFLSQRKIENVEVFNVRKKSEDSEVKSLLFVSSNLIIEPHPEEYLADRIRKTAANMNI